MIRPPPQSPVTTIFTSAKERRNQVMKKLLIIVMTLLFALYPVSVYAVPSDYDSLLEEYNDLKAKYKKLKKKYDKLKEQTGGEAVAEAPAPEAPASDGGGYVYQDSGYTYTYLRSEIVPEDGTNHLVVYFNFVNQSENEIMPMLGCDISGYQNFVELNTFRLFMSGISEISAASTNIRSGGSIDFAYSFELQDMSDVTISLSPMFNFGGAKPFEFVIHLPGLETELLS